MTYTINPNAKNVWIRDNEDTMDLSPITDASSVYLENGRTLEQELGEGSMVSNVATVDNSMSKVIDGTLDGVYESGVMYGRSLVNLFNKLGQELVQYADVASVKEGMIKPSTKYLLQIKNNTSEEKQYYSADITEWLTLTVPANSQLIKIITTKSVLPTRHVILQNHTTHSMPNNININFIEYQDGMENWDIPYFEGMCDVKMPILRNVGKNLFDGVLEKGNFNGGTNNIRSSTFTLEELRTYTISNDKNYSANVVFHDDNNQYISEIPISKLPYTFTTPLKTKYVWIRTWSNQDDLTVKFQIEKGSTATSYEDHKTNILHTPEIVTLRSLPNGVRDELNLKTGEYIKRIGEIVLNGSENWALTRKDTLTNVFELKLSQEWVTNQNVVCDRFDGTFASVFKDGKEGIKLTGNFIYVNILNTRSETAEMFKVYLQSNPVTVQYELQTPITTKVALTQSEPIVKIGTELPNGVCDTYNLLTGEHIQRVGKVVLDGSEDWKIGTTKTVTQVFELVVNDLDIKTKRNNLVCDSLPISNGDSSDTEKIASTDSTGGSGKTSSLYIALLKTKASTVEQLKTYLASNPITVWYGLKSPIVTKKNGLPNTHGVTLPSGVVDKYNESTGVYTQNVGVEYVGDNGTFDNIIQQSNGTRIHYNLGESIRPIRTKVLTDDRFTFKDTWSETHEPYSVFIGSGLDMYFVIPTSEGVTTIAQAKDWFEANKTLLYYELATPKTIDIPLINAGQVLPNGVCDTYNPITKEYVKRVSGTVLVGNEDWSLMDSPYETDCIGFVTPCSLANWTQSQANLNIVCEGYVGNYELWNVDEEGFSVFKDPTRLAIKVKRSKLSTADINGFKKFLKLNPLAVWYELATPEVSTVDLDLSTLYSSSPIAYENGHIILESGHDGQSLLPTLEYSTVTNRVKQIENIGEQVLRQEKQLTMLEQMLIQGIVGMDYNNTLLTLNLEIDEVM